MNIVRERERPKAWTVGSRGRHLAVPPSRRALWVCADASRLNFQENTLGGMRREAGKRNQSVDSW